MCELPQWCSSVLANPNTTSEGEALRMWLHERERRASGEETTSEKKKKGGKKKHHRTPPRVSAHAELQENAKKKKKPARVSMQTPAAPVSTLQLPNTICQLWRPQD